MLNWEIRDKETKSGENQKLSNLKGLDTVLKGKSLV